MAKHVHQPESRIKAHCQLGIDYGGINCARAESRTDANEGQPVLSLLSDNIADCLAADVRNTSPRQAAQFIGADTQR